MDKKKSIIKSKRNYGIGIFLTIEYVYIAILFINAFTLLLKRYNGLIFSFKNGFFIEIIILIILNILIEYISNQKKLNLKSLKKTSFIIGLSVFIIGMLIFHKINTNIFIWLIDIISCFLIITLIPELIINLKKQKTLYKLGILPIILFLNIFLPTSINSLLSKTIFRNHYYTSQSFYNEIVDSYNSYNKTLYPYIVNINNLTKDKHTIEFTDFRNFNVPDAMKAINNMNVSDMGNKLLTYYFDSINDEKENYLWKFADKNESTANNVFNFKLRNSSLNKLTIKNEDNSHINFNLRNGSSINELIMQGKVDSQFDSANVNKLQIKNDELQNISISDLIIKDSLEINNFKINLNNNVALHLYHNIKNNNSSIYIDESLENEKFDSLYFKSPGKIKDLDFGILNVKLTDANGNPKNENEYVENNDKVKLYYEDFQGNEIIFANLSIVIRQ